MVQREADVQQAFVQYLLDRRWDVHVDNADHTDVIAKRGAELLVAEVKGKTTEPGLDVDTGYGQLLRAISRYPDASTYALVAPEALLTAVTRVSPEVRGRVGIELYLVDDLGQVRQLSSQAD